MWQKTKNIYHLAQAVATHAINGFPAEGPIFIGVTGTDGKTTTSNMIYHILSKAGKKSAIVSTVGAIIDGKEYDTGFHITTPDSSAIVKYIKQAKKANAEYVILEVTSHALDQNRVFGIPFTIGVLTNVTHEHLDYHKTYEDYLAAKMKLLRNAKIIVMNRDDDSFKYVQKSKLDNKKLITYGLRANADINPEKFHFQTNLLGDFNEYNCLAAISVCLQLDIDSEMIRKSLLDFAAPKGRAEIIYPSLSLGNRNFTIMIDFAHTPNSLDRILCAVRKEMKNKGRIIHVFGSAGLRDREKRPLMGAASAKYADIIVLTAEDPRTENIEDIIQQIESGIADSEARIANKTVVEIKDRQEAINYAVSIAQQGDIIIITGKGHEQSMNYGKGEIYWSDHQAIELALQNRHAIQKS